MLHYAVPGSGAIVCGAKLAKPSDAMQVIAHYADDVTCPDCLASPRFQKIIGTCSDCGVAHVRACCQCDGGPHDPACPVALAERV